MRRLIAFPCVGETLLGTIDDAPGATGLLIVSGGNEIRGGAHRGMALLAGRLAATGTPVFRYDRRGVGDSSGANTGFGEARDDLIAAAAAFRTTAPHVGKIVGFGNCDAATTLAWWGHDARLDAIVIANPWVVAPTGDMPAPAALRAHYASRLRDPRAWLTLLRGGVSLGRLFSGLRRSIDRSEQQLTGRTLTAIAAWGERAQVILAKDDATAIAYAAAARTARIDPLTTVIDTASHSFARAVDVAALEAAIRHAINA